MGDCDLDILWVELKQILHLKLGCSDFGPVQDRGSLPYLPYTSPILIMLEPFTGTL